MLSLKSRIIATLCLFSLLLSLVFAGIAILVSVASQDYVFNNAVRHVTDQVMHNYLENQTLHDKHMPPEVRSYVGLDGLSQDEIIKFRLETLPDGIHKAIAPIKVHYSITSIPGLDKKLYVFMDVHEFEFEFDQDKLLILALQFGIPALLTSLVGALIGLILAKHIISPVRRLADKVMKTRPENLIVDFSARFADDEIGNLARSIEATLHRLARFIAREQEFTRNVSHELRTPLAVIKNGSELLRSNTASSDTWLCRPLDRIDRAVAEMEQLVETFLFLAREKDLSARSQSCDIYDKVTHLLNRYDFLLQGRNVVCTVRESGRPQVNVAPEVLDIILGNCIRNAFQYTESGEVKVEIDPQCITMTNDIGQDSGMGNDRANTGIGHSITSKLCERLGWIFTFEAKTDKARAVICYSADR
ncbi:MAG: HAMP domain-containing sensor histidine kinase [Desulfoprunum sp.]|nr:HAMP domain-containing sensor histidine kinase [Desulfoprunum sp.]